MCSCLIGPSCFIQGLNQKVETTIVSRSNDSDMIKDHTNVYEHSNLIWFCTICKVIVTIVASINICFNNTNTLHWAKATLQQQDSDSVATQTQSLARIISHKHTDGSTQPAFKHK